MIARRPTAPLPRPLVWALVCLALPAIGPTAAPVPADAIVARVNGDAILLSQLREAAIDQNVSLDSMAVSGVHGEGFRRALTQYVDELLLMQKARSEGIEADSGEIARQVDAIIQSLQRRLGSPEALEAFLDQHFLTLDSLRNVLSQREQRRSLAVEVVAKRVTVDTQKVEVFSAMRQQDGEPVEQVNLAQILVRCPEEEQAGERGRELYLQALRVAREAGKDLSRFDELVAGYSDDDDGRLRGGSLGWLDPATLRPSLRDQAARLRQGEISTPIVTNAGYHVLIVRGRRSTRELTFAEEFGREREKMIEQLRREAAIELYDFQGKRLDPPAPVESTELDQTSQPPTDQTDARPAMPGKL